MEWLGLVRSGYEILQDMSAAALSIACEWQLYCQFGSSAYYPRFILVTTISDHAKFMEKYAAGHMRLAPFQWCTQCTFLKSRWECDVIYRGNVFTWCVSITSRQSVHRISNYIALRSVLCDSRSPYLTDYLKLNCHEYAIPLYLFIYSDHICLSKIQRYI